MSRDELTRLLCLRAPGHRYRFAITKGPPAELRIARLREGAAAFAAGNGAADELAGAVLVGADFKLLFCSAADPQRVLSWVAEWTRKAMPRSPAVAALIGAGAVQWKGDPGDAGAIEAIDPDALRVHREDALWTGAADASVGGVVAVLAASLPGERLWYWMTAEPGRADLPLLLQPVSADPHRDAMNALIDVVERGGAGRAVTGTAHVTEDGSIQFVGARLVPELLDVLAGWVRQWVGEHPAIARLSGCRLLPAAGGWVQSVIENPELWDDLPRPIAPATLAETEAHLAALQPGQDCWFWLTVTAPEGVFLSVAPRSDDPEGIAFGMRVRGLYRRFPDSFSDAVLGVVRRQEAAGLVFATAKSHVEDWPALRQRLAERHPAVAEALATAELFLGEAAAVIG